MKQMNFVIVALSKTTIQIKSLVDRVAHDSTNIDKIMCHQVLK
jgi:hypothetical protein